MDEPILPENAAAIARLLYSGQHIPHMTDDMSAVIESYAGEIADCGLDPLERVAETHFRFVQAGGDTRTAGLVSFWQCLNYYITPLYIHAENAETYQLALETNTESLLALMKQEQAQYRKESIPFVIDYTELGGYENVYTE